MKLSPYFSTSLAVGAFLLAGSFMLAQARSAARNRQFQSGSAPGTTMQSIAVDHAGGNGVRRADTGKSGDNPLFEGKGHGTEVITPAFEQLQFQSRKSGSKTGTKAMNPLYKDSGKSGTNPLYEGKGQANLNPNAGTSTVESKDSAPPKKHIAGVKYEDRVAGNSPEGTAGHSTHDVVQQRKDTSVIGAHETADRNSAHATESLRTSSNAKAEGNPLYQDSGKSGSNPMYEPSKIQNAGTTGNPNPPTAAQRPKRPGRMKFGTIRIR